MQDLMLNFYNTVLFCYEKDKITLFAGKWAQLETVHYMK